MIPRRRDRSPLHGATATQLAALRTLVHAYRDWERRMGTDAQTLAPHVPSVGRHLSLGSHIERDLTERVNRRVRARGDAGDIDRRRTALLPGRREDTLQSIHQELVRIRTLLEAR